jgi:hypothetical protein
MRLKALTLGCLAAAACVAQPDDSHPTSRYITFAGNFDAGYRKTQFFVEDHHTALGQWDTRTEVWLPPFRTKFAWGAYLRVAGVGASKAEAWENGLLAMPGAGFQVYPFSAIRSEKSAWRRVFGPLRTFGEYNRLHYWGEENEWRPRRQIRAGMEYWRALRVNATASPWWAETWNGLWWQSANEYDSRYRGWILAGALRGGVRCAGSRVWSAVTPYAALESSLTDQRTYYWENRLLLGGGVRIAPSLDSASFNWLSRLVVYGEYLHAAAYYRQGAPLSVPDHDVRVGISFSFGEWYRR